MSILNHTLSTLWNKSIIVYRWSKQRGGLCLVCVRCVLVLNSGYVCLVCVRCVLVLNSGYVYYSRLVNWILNTP